VGGSFPPLARLFHLKQPLEQSSRENQVYQTITSSTWTIKSIVEDHQILQIIKVPKVNFENTAQHTRIGRDALDDLTVAAIKTK
jgi:hypothetical protein